MNDPSVLARGAIATGFDGTQIDSKLPHFGGYVLFAGNGTSPEQVRLLTDALRARAGEPAPLIAIDQEGGRVVRLREGVEAIPSMMALGAVGDLELAERAGEQTAFDLRRAGCTLDFAPVLDLALDPSNTVIGTRSFGSDPTVVAALGAAFARGLERGGIVPCFKHFPGHGSTATDSHLALPAVDADEATLRARDLSAFAAVAKDAQAIMGGHLIVRAFDALRPATLSRRIGEELLRGELGFAGAYVTDCLEMGALEQRSAAENAVAAVAAGADLLLFSHSPDRALAAAEAIEAAVRGGLIPLERLRQAHARVRALRMRAAPPLEVDAPAPHPGVGREIARRAITLVRGMPHVDPVAAIAVSFGGDASLAREAPALEQCDAALDPGAAEIERMLEEVAAGGRRPLVLARRAHLHASQAHAIDCIVQRYPDAVVVSMLEPFDLPSFSGARHVLAAYGDDEASIGGLADVLFGGSRPMGRLPVVVPHA